MIRVNTVFVIGAGASSGINLPTGQELRNEVITIARNNARKTMIAKIAGAEETLVDRFASDLEQSGKLSVDAFLEHRKDLLAVGKVAMALALVRREEVPRLFDPKQADWQHYLLSKMNAPIASFGENCVSFVTFNYDRSLEEFLFTTLRKSSGASVEECCKQLARIPIVHLHGTLGPLPWQNPLKGRPYGPAKDEDSVLMASEGIKIISELSTVEDMQPFSHATALLRNARRVAFLGFGYDFTNMNRLCTVDILNKEFILGTGVGLSSAEIGDAVRGSRTELKIRKDVNCLELLKEVSWVT